MTSNQAEWSWRISWRSVSWTDLDLTAQHVAVLMILNGRDDWADLNMAEAVNEARREATAGPQRFVNTVIALVSVDRTPEDADEDTARQELLDVIAEIRKTPIVDLLEAIEFR